MRFLIDGCYGDGNIGDECLLQAVGRRIREVDADAEISVFSADPAVTRAETGWQAIGQCNPFGRNLYGSLVKGQLRQTVDAIRNCDTFILGGGELFRDNVGVRATLGMFYRMRLARLLGKKVLALGVGAQPATTWWGRHVLRSALHAAHATVFRDRDSLLVAQDLSPDLEHAWTMPDMVFSLDWGRFRRETQGRHRAPEPLRVGVAVKSLPGKHACREDAHDHLPQSLSQVLSRVAQTDNLEISVLPFAEADRAEAERLRSRLQAVGLKLTDPILPAISTLRHEVAGLDCLLAVPLHASVFAFACGVPSIGLAYDAKIPRLYEGWGMDQWSLDIRGLGTDELERAFRKLLQQRAELRVRLIQSARDAERTVCRTLDGLLAWPPSHTLAAGTC